MGQCDGIAVYKGWSRVCARTGTLKNPAKCLWPGRRSNFFFSPPAHRCAVTYMTEISLIMTLNNQFTSPHLLYSFSLFGWGVSEDVDHDDDRDPDELKDDDDDEADLVRLLLPFDLSRGLALATEVSTS